MLEGRVLSDGREIGFDEIGDVYFRSVRRRDDHHSRFRRCCTRIELRGGVIDLAQKAFGPSEYEVEDSPKLVCWVEDV